jgi:hypothetical protein
MEPDRIDARPTTHDDQGSRRVSRAPDSLRQTTRDQLVARIQRRHRGPAARIPLAITCPSAARVSAHHREALNQAHLGLFGGKVRIGSA